MQTPTHFKAGQWTLAVFFAAACHTGQLPAAETPVVESAPGLRAAPSCAAPLADEAFLESYALTGAYRLGKPSSVTVTPDGSAVLFLRSPARSAVRDLFEFDVATGTERVLLTADSILQGATEELSAEERARRERLRLSAKGIASFELSGDGKTLLIPLSGQLYVVDRATKAVRTLVDEGGYPNEARFSPDAKSVACVREGDLYVIDVASNRQTRLTRTANEHLENGTPEFIAQEEMGRFEGYWWSPDSKTLVYQETNSSEVPVWSIHDPLHPERAASTTRYPQAGAPNVSVRLGMIAARGGRTKWIEWDHTKYPYLVKASWTARGPLTLVVQDRAQRDMGVFKVTEAGLTSLLMTAQDDVWLNIDQSVPVWLSPTRGFLWSTERDGHYALELRNADGSFAKALTPPAFGYRDLVHVDYRNDSAYVLASDNPTTAQVWKVSLAENASAPTAITTGQGDHAAIFADESDTWVHIARTIGARDQWSVQTAAGAKPLISNQEEPPFAPNVELVTIGARGFHGAILRPRNFEAGQKCPVLDWVYGGPGHIQVTASRDRYLLAQWYADHGYIVVTFDGRGTPSRGREWERATYGKFGTLALEDQVEGLQALGAAHPELDLDRVGVFGWSFGGYLSALAVERRPDVFKAAFAGAPVTDWHDYDTHYTERYMGMPQANAEAYERESVTAHAAELTRPLLLVHGTIDDNVYFVHAMKLSNALFRAGISHDFLPLSGATHMVSDPVSTRGLQTRVMNFFAQHLK